jgi:hypothetical protein
MCNEKSRRKGKGIEVKVNLKRRNDREFLRKFI